MKKWLNKEYVVKTKRWNIVLDTMINTIIVLIIMYYLLTEYGVEIARFINEMNKAGTILDFILIMAPLVLIIVGMLEAGYYIAYANRPEPVKIAIKKQKKPKKR